ncbi:DUF3807 domain-containing protein [Aspergillus mulundensis]|uniref:Uncharacterized protein n=1 Tax=Aspergillus mulundensis TaxID=1810919 RepID=A0A3D8S6Q3_9EURO|nr:hypothetical protein DSM5745_05251 [Aspergillus mulundensis]RDW81694.1 hypothetical protein DSM5745_05251 [Aspergillus mulundensis]
MSYHVPPVTLEDLQAFQAKHFPATLKPPAIPPLDTYTENHYSNDEADEEDNKDDDLGYYPDGVKRTLTDEQIRIFRHSEVHALLRERQIAKENEEYERQYGSGAEPGPRVDPQVQASGDRSGSSKEMEALSGSASPKLRTAAVAGRKRSAEDAGYGAGVGSHATARRKSLSKPSTKSSAPRDVHMDYNEESPAAATATSQPRGRQAASQFMGRRIISSSALSIPSKTLNNSKRERERERERHMLICGPQWGWYFANIAQMLLAYSYLCHQVNCMRPGFGTIAQKNATPMSKPTIIGCRTMTPAREAIAPVKNGNAAQPTDPKLAANPDGVSVLNDIYYLSRHAPIAPRWSSCGTTWPEHQLETECQRDVYEDHASLAEPMRDVCQSNATQGEAAPEDGCNLYAQSAVEYRVWFTAQGYLSSRIKKEEHGEKPKRPMCQRLAQLSPRSLLSPFTIWLEQPMPERPSRKRSVRRTQHKRDEIVKLPPRHPRRNCIRNKRSQNCSHPIHRMKDPQPAMRVTHCHREAIRLGVGNPAAETREEERRQEEGERGRPKQQCEADALYCDPEEQRPASA